MKSIQQYLFEASTTKVNILVGRFQPFTLGHLKCAEYVWKTYKIPTVICIIETTKADEKHPFLTSLLWNTYKKMVKNRDCFIDIIKVKNADLVKIGEALGLKGYTIKHWACGTDRYNDYVKMCKKYAPGVEVVEIKRSDDDISATQVRQVIRADHRERFEELVPQEEYTLYDKLKESLNWL